MLLLASNRQLMLIDSLYNTCINSVQDLILLTNIDVFKIHIVYI
jgi:hypothetical protein